MLKFHTSVLTSAALAALLVGIAFEQACAAPPAGAETPQQAAPQGEDPPGADEGAEAAPPTEHNGVIQPPATGDEGIHTEVPNPNAGPGDEIIPPSELSGGQNAEPK
jgi:hypothetical protein